MQTTPPATYVTCRKTSRIEANLVMDVVVKYFQPFDSLIPQDRVGIDAFRPFYTSYRFFLQIKLFETFYCYFSNTERAYVTYSKFGNDENNDSLIMPDGEVVKISELEKFYVDGAKGDPTQLVQ